MTSRRCKILNVSGNVLASTTLVLETDLGSFPQLNNSSHSLDYIMVYAGFNSNINLIFKLGMLRPDGLYINFFLVTV